MITVHPNLHEVELASSLQRRFYRTIRETMRAMAGRIAGVANWEAKKMLAGHRSGNHGYDVFLPRIEAKCARMPALANPEHFQPLGSSAATTSYGLNG